MAQFYAHIQGSRGPASRLGCKASGMQVSVKSWDGEISIRMQSTVKGDWVSVYLQPHSNSIDSGSHAICLYSGPCAGWRDYFERSELGRMAWNVEHGRKAA